MECDCGGDMIEIREEVVDSVIETHYYCPYCGNTEVFNQLLIENESETD
jgi:predicted RNA-binding Zn-ribbon protein involved in translation (DUF1610 family)